MNNLKEKELMEKAAGALVNDTGEKVELETVDVSKAEPEKILSTEELSKLASSCENARVDMINEGRIANPHMPIDESIPDSEECMIATNAAGVSEIVPDLGQGRIVKTFDGLLDEDLFSEKLMINPGLADDIKRQFTLTNEEFAEFNDRAVSLHKELLLFKRIETEGSATIILEPDNITIRQINILLGELMHDKLIKQIVVDENSMKNLTIDNMSFLFIESINMYKNMINSDTHSEHSIKYANFMIDTLIKDIDIDDNLFADKFNKFIEMDFKEVTKGENGWGDLHKLGELFIKENKITAYNIAMLSDLVHKGFMDNGTYLLKIKKEFGLNVVSNTGMYDQGMVNVQESLSSIIKQFKDETKLDSENIVDKMEEYFTKAANESNNPKKKARSKEIMDGIRDAETLNLFISYIDNHRGYFNRNLIRYNRKKTEAMYDREIAKLYSRLDKIKFTFDNPYGLCDKLTDILDDKFNKVLTCKKFLIMLFKYINTTGFKDTIKDEMNVSTVFFTSRLFRYLMTYDSISKEKQESIKKSVMDIMVKTRLVKYEIK